MSALPEHPTPRQVEAHFRSFLREAGIAPPDEVEHDLRRDEVTFIWRAPKVAIVIELNDAGPSDVRLEPAA